MEHSQRVFSRILKSGLVIIKFVLIKASHGVAQQLEFVLAQIPKGAHVDCTPW